MCMSTCACERVCKIMCVCVHVQKTPTALENLLLWQVRGCEYVCERPSVCGREIVRVQPGECAIALVGACVWERESVCM